VLPVDGESNSQGSRDFVDAASGKQHNLCITCHGRGKMPVFGQQDPLLFDAARGDCAVGGPACDNNSVLTGRTQQRPSPCSISSHKTAAPAEP
jgi:hypothetical protein